MMEDTSAKRDILDAAIDPDINIVLICVGGKWYEHTQTAPRYLGATLREAVTKLSLCEYEQAYGKLTAIL